MALAHSGLRVLRWRCKRHYKARRRRIARAGRPRAPLLTRCRSSLNQYSLGRRQEGRSPASLGNRPRDRRPSASLFSTVSASRCNRRPGGNSAGRSERLRSVAEGNPRLGRRRLGFGQLRGASTHGRNGRPNPDPERSARRDGRIRPLVRVLAKPSAGAGILRRLHSGVRGGARQRGLNRQCRTAAGDQRRRRFRRHARGRIRLHGRRGRA